MSQQAPTGSLLQTLRLIPGQLGLALGPRGLLLAIVAAVVGAMCFSTALTQVVAPLHPSEVRRTQQEAAEIAVLDGGYREFMRTINALSLGARRPRTGERPVLEAWQKFFSELTRICTGDFAISAKGQRLSALCEQRLDIGERIGAEITAFDPPQRALDPAISRELLSISRSINEVGTTVQADAARLVGVMSRHYGEALTVLRISTAGFALAGLILISLIGLASIRHFQERRKAEAAAKAANESRDLLRETIEALPAGVVLYDQHDRLMLFNSLAASITPALARPGSIGTTYGALAAEAGIAREAAGLGSSKTWLTEQLARFASKGKSSYRHLPDGRWIEMFERGTPAGRTVGLRVDVTELKTQQQEIEKSRAAYQSLIDSLSDVIVAVDNRARFTFASAPAAELFGRPADTLAGTKVREFIHPEDWERVKAIALELQNSDDDTTREMSFRLRVGDRVRHVEARFRRSFGAATPNSMLTGVIRDVEERVQLARRLEEEMAHLRAIVESSGATIVLTDRDLRVVMVNSELAALAGVRPGDAIGRPLSSIIEHPVGEATLTRWTGGPLESPQPVRFTHTLKDAQGQQRIINITANPVLDDDRVVRNIVFLGVDDTARRETELQLFDAERMRGIGEMAATVAHEVNQPLQVIRLATEVTIEEMGEAATRGEKIDEGFVQGKLERIMAQVERASRLVKELRAHSRSTYGEAAQAFDPAQAVRGAVDLTQHLVQQEAIAFTLNMPASLPLVYGHVGRLEQVLINLVNNARDSLAEIPVRDARRSIVLSAASLHKDGREFLHLAVDDSGPGIADHVLPRLFVPFVTTKARGKGTGLGLPLCQRIVEEMGGTISAANRAEGGARFEILLPATSVQSLPRVA